MARIRTIKPSFFQSEDVSALPLRARLTWIGLWTHCDDQGRTKDNAKLIKANVWALDDVSLRDIEDDLETLAAHGRIVRYEVDGGRYLAIVNWHEHQSIQKKQPSKIPAPTHDPRRPPPPRSGSPTVAVPEHDGSAIAGKGKEGKGKEGRAPNGAPRARPPQQRSRNHDPDCANGSGQRTAREHTTTAHSPHAHELVETYSASRNYRPPAAVRRKLARHVDELLAEDWPDELISRAMAAWGDKGLDASVLPSVANEVANRALGRTTSSSKPGKDDKIRALQSLKSQPLQAIEGSAT